MKIAQVLASRGDGGLEKHVYELSLALAERGHEITVIADPVFIRKLPTHIQSIAIPSHYSRHDPRLLWSLGKSFRQGQFDIVHAQANKAATLVNSLRYFFSGQRVATLHNIKRQLGAYRHFNQVIAVSKHLAKPFADENVTVIYNGIRTPLITKGLQEKPNAFPLLLAVGRLVPAKGFDVLIKAVADLPVTLWIAGDGPQKEHLQSLIDALSTTADIQLIGDRQDIIPLMQQADALIISSRREGFSYVFNEALLTQCRVLATDVPVANEILSEELIVPIDDPQVLKERLQSLLADMSQWSALMQKPYAVAEQCMTLTAMTDQTLALYRKLISS
ncbi:MULTISPECIES: glycosyltransferase [unclassified Methylophaga]|jgi:glycosyltransferase involved in cell wall biosynthesis|uniref:glycosyltransferase n=1 Tax=unclassified Methylophaga TaxID=2629249 RepID=UPI000C6BB1A8|nr:MULTISPECIES: glycosyltransferase [unclassified Methylophaga]MAM29048.1 glycosyltransferase [Flavobacteriaceae bacterium]MAL50721.1 glycosyltransferase [Methylophaga sp.]MBP23984.1 glycosyltransferase [Methylophaga sp.]HAD32657.1 glycosyltransferase [Methylophaga sp.]HCC80800.1 glycosyltransferase [Methylophaga sp.]|tara:strand:+ start:5823 stop:6821 length:999 start_codon:yes stop_codon:yes gene_type:complete